MSEKNLLDSIYDKYDKLENYYEKYDIDYLASTSRIINKLESLLVKSKKNHDSEKYNDVLTAYYYLVKYRDEYDKKLKEMGVKFPLTKKQKKFKLIKKVIIAGVIVAVGLSVGTQVKDNYQENLKSNVCVEYEIEAGDTKNELEDEYGLKDISFEHYEIPGFARQQAAGWDTSRFLAAGDVIIARTTKENAEKLVSEKGAKIISKEEALSMLEESGLYSYSGVFSDALNGDDTFVFYEPTNEKTLG